MESQGINWLVGVLLLVVVAAALIPQIITTIADTDTSDWDSLSPALAILWHLLPLFVVIGLVLYLVRHSGKAKA